MCDFVCFCGHDGNFVVRRDAIIGLCDARISESGDAFEAKVMLNTNARLSITMGMGDNEIQKAKEDYFYILSYFFGILGFGYAFDDATSE